LADCDVDAADLHLVLEPRIEHAEDFSGGKQARIIHQKCDRCGVCLEVCRFQAVKEFPNPVESLSVDYQIDPISCEGCGVCERACPKQAIVFKPVINGKWYISDTRHGPLVHAKLGIAQENSGKLVTLVRNQAKILAREKNLDLIIIDGPPGIGCPVIASITGADLVMVVTEPTQSGRHDLERVSQLTKHFGIETLICINKWDINPDIAARIESEAKKRGVRVAGKVRYDNTVTVAQIEKLSTVEYSENGVAKDIKKLWREVAGVLTG